jgi:nicotinate dehydrogenase subunit A
MIARTVTLTVNGRDHELTLDSGAMLLNVLRNDLGLNGPKYGCGLAQCGACTVWVAGVPARSCVLPAAPLTGFPVTTLEGLGDGDRPHPVQQAFIAFSATQCGYCVNGMIMTIAALLEENPDVTEANVRHALRYVLCRCGSHVEVLAAAMHAAEAMRGTAA